MTLHKRSIGTRASEIRQYAHEVKRGRVAPRSLILRGRSAAPIANLASTTFRDTAAARALRQLTHPVATGRAAISSLPAGKAAQDALREMREGGMRELARTMEDELLGAAGVGFARDVARYAEGKAGWRDVLRDAGPVGRTLDFLAGLTGDLGAASDDDIKNAIQLLEAQGYTVEPPDSSELAKPTAGSYDVEAPGGHAEAGGGLHGAGSVGKSPMPKLPVGTFPGGLYVPMTVVSSSNVYAIGYDESTLTMRVQYLAAAVNALALKGRGHTGEHRMQGTLGKTVRPERSGPGPVYDYHGVPRQVFLRVFDAKSIGGAIWDQLRVRGTVYGHKFDYELVAASTVNVMTAATSTLGAAKKVGFMTYVPRKAVGPNQFGSRQIKQGNRVFRSVLPAVGLG